MEKSYKQLKQAHQTTFIPPQKSQLSQNLLFNDYSNQQPHSNISQQTQLIQQSQIFPSRIQSILENPTHKLQYYQYFLDIQQQANLHIENCTHNQQSLINHKIVILTQNQSKLSCYSQPIVHLVGNTHQGAIIKYQVIIGSFKLDIDLLNVFEYSTQRLSPVGTGSYGSVYKISHRPKLNLANKRYYFNKQTFTNLDNFEGKWTIIPNKQQIDHILCEYSIYKICSLYKIGPKVISQLGFDVICFCDSIQFYMQLGIQIRGKVINIQKDMKLNLRVIHKLKIIHKDIKPSNMLFSIQYNRYVLNDFGISHTIQEDVAQKSRTYKQGTLNYMSDEMANIPQGYFSYVNLYQNDLQALKKSLNELKKTNVHSKVSQRVETSLILYRRSSAKLNVEYCEIYLLHLLIGEYNQQFIMQYLKQIKGHLKKYRFGIKCERLYDILKRLQKQRQFNNQNWIDTNCNTQNKQIQYLIRCYGLSRRLQDEIQGLPYKKQIMIVKYLIANHNYKIDLHHNPIQNQKFNNQQFGISEYDLWRQQQYLQLKYQKIHKNPSDKSLYQLKCIADRILTLYYKILIIKIQQVYLAGIQKIKLIYQQINTFVDSNNPRHLKILQISQFIKCLFLNCKCNQQLLKTGVQIQLKKAPHLAVDIYKILIKYYKFNWKKQLQYIILLQKQYKNSQFQEQILVDFQILELKKWVINGLLRQQSLPSTIISCNQCNKTYNQSIQFIRSNRTKKQDKIILKLLKQLRQYSYSYYKIRTHNTRQDLLIKCLQYLAFNSQFFHRYQQSLDYLKQRLRKVQLLYGYNSINICYMYFQIGHAYFKIKNYELAKYYFQKQLEVNRLRSYTVDIKRVWNSLLLLSLISLIYSDKQRFQKYFKEGSSIHAIFYKKLYLKKIKRQQQQNQLPQYDIESLTDSKSNAEHQSIVNITHIQLSMDQLTMLQKSVDQQIRKPKDIKRDQKKIQQYLRQMNCFRLVINRQKMQLLYLARQFQLMKKPFDYHRFLQNVRKNTYINFSKICEKVQNLMKNVLLFTQKFQQSKQKTIQLFHYVQDFNKQYPVKNYILLAQFYNRILKQYQQNKIKNNYTEIYYLIKEFYAYRLKMLSGQQLKNDIVQRISIILVKLINNLFDIGDYLKTWFFINIYIKNKGSLKKKQKMTITFIKTCLRLIRMFNKIEIAQVKQKKAKLWRSIEKYLKYMKPKQYQNRINERKQRLYRKKYINLLIFVYKNNDMLKKIIPSIVQIQKEHGQIMNQQGINEQIVNVVQRCDINMRKVSKLFLEIKRLKQIKIFKNRVEYMGDKKYLNKICNNKISKLG